MKDDGSGFGELIILRATEMNLGSIKTNIDSVLEAVKEKAKEYQDVTKYSGDEKQAKEDRALLRKQKELAKTTLASIQEMWNKPLTDALSGGREILKQFDLAIDSIDTWVKEGEALEKENKRKEIQIYFDGKDFDLVPLEKFFDSRWLNKTFKMPDIKTEIDGKIKEVYANIKALENISEYGTMAKAFYLETLDMASALHRVETMKADAERLAREKAAREERQRQEQVLQNAAEERREERQTAKEEQIQSLVNEALDLPEPEVKKPEIIEFTLRFKGTRGQLFKLREYMTANGISYEKIV